MKVILKQQLIHLHEHALSNFVVNVVNGAILCIALATVIDVYTLAWWFSLLLVINIFRYTISYHDKNLCVHGGSLQRSLYLYSLGAGLSALVWGVGAVFLFPQNSLPHQIFHVLILGAVLTGIIPTLAAVKQLFWVSLFTILTPLVVVLAFHPSDVLHLIMGAVMLVYGVTLYTSASFLSKTFENLFESHLQLNILATQDGLTGIANRRKFDEALNKDWYTAMRNQEFITLVLLDIDCFKQYNDFYGHQAGDLCIKSVAATLSDTVKRATDTVARYGGDEFAIILPITPPDGAKIVAERVRQAVEAANIPHERSSISDQVTVSVGVVSVIPHPNQAFGVLLKSADKSLYESKRKGRNAVSTSVISHTKASEPTEQPQPEAVS